MAEDLSSLSDEELDARIAALEAPKAEEGGIGENILSFMTGIGKTVPFGQDIPALVSAGRSYLGMKPKGVPEEGEFAERFAGAKEAQEEAAKILGKRAPWSQRAGMATGIIGSISPLGRAAAAEEATAAALTKALPSAVTKVLPRAAPTAVKGTTGLGFGAGLGAAYGLGEGTTLEERLANAGTGAKMGAATAAALPLLAGVGKEGYKAIKEYLPGLISGAEKAGMSKIGEALETDVSRKTAGLTPQEMAEAQARGQPVMPVDIGGPTLRGEVRTAANLYPEAEATMAKTLRDRYEAQAGRYQKQISGMMPYKVDAAGMQEDLRAAAHKINNPAYKAAYKQGESGIWNPELETFVNAPAIKDVLPAAIKKSANRAALEGTAPVKNPFITDASGKLTLEPGTKPTLEFWDNVKRSLDDEIGSLRRNGREDEAIDLNKIKNRLLSNLDKAVSSYKTARSGAAKMFDADNAFDAGLNFMSMKDTLKLSEAKQAINKMSRVEREIFAHGVAADVIQKIKHKGLSTDISNMFNTPESREKMILALGPKRSLELEAFSRVENIMADAHRAITANSTTAKQASRMGALKGAAKDIVGEIGPILAGTSLGGLSGAVAAYAAKRVVSHLSDTLTKDAALAMAEKLVSQKPEDIKEVVDMLVKNPQAMRKLRAYPVVRQVLTEAGTELFERPKRATGGPVTKELTAETLLRMAKNSRKKIQNDTEPLLEEPDENVVTALKVANKHI